MTESDLRWRLRQLPRDIEPDRDLWQGIAARIEARPVRRAPRRWWTSLALAASVAARRRPGLAVAAGPVAAVAGRCHRRAWWHARPRR